MVQRFFKLLSNSIEAYLRNAKLLSAFSIPFLVAFPLALVLPNFVSLGSIFLRFGSVKADLTVFDSFLIVTAFALSLLVFSSAIVAVNMVIKSQRTLLKISAWEREQFETHTLRMFYILLVVFVATFLVNVFLYEYGLHNTLGALFAFAVATVVLFAPQALVIDDLKAKHAVERSVAIILRRLPFVFSFFLFAAFLLVFNAWVFLQLQSVFGLNARFLAVFVNALFILPFLEVLKTQIYLSKYTIL
ncbi:MAG: hypothetical protein ACE5DI_03940 [Candidatus Micrarchaeia archaeon]